MPSDGPLFFTDACSLLGRPCPHPWMLFAAPRLVDTRQPSTSWPLCLQVHAVHHQPDLVCSQYRLHQLEEGTLSSRYPTPHAAPPKDNYPKSELRAKVRARCGSRWPRSSTMENSRFHTTFNGPVPLTYVNNGVYEGGSNEYYEVHTRDYLLSMDFVMEYHRIPRWDVD